MMPFPGGITATGNGTLVLAVVLALAYLFLLDAAPTWRRTAVKTGAVLLLGLLAAQAGGPALLVTALLASAAGDAFLSREGEAAFLAGLACFLAGHVAYLALFIGLAGPPSATTLRLVPAVVLVAFCAVMALVLWRRVGRPLRLPVMAYCAVILAMGLAALRVPGMAIAGGALLFVASDAILAAERFLMRPDAGLKRWSGPAVWVLYFAAQTAITLGVLL